MTKLIVNADDFGMTLGVNRGILEAHRSGIVTSTTLMANGLAFGDAVAAAREFPTLGIGIHLNLSEGSPVSPPDEIPSLVDAQGHLRWVPEQLWKAIATRKVRSADIETELRAQVAKVLDAGISPTHVDGHMHVHVLPGVSKLVVKVAREAKIGAVRCPIEPASSLLRRLSKDPQIRLSATTRRFISLGISSAARGLRRLLDQAGLAYPARFYGIVETGFLDLPGIAAILRALPKGPGVNELMCHPGYVDENLSRVGGLLQSQREREVRALTSPETARLITTRHIQLTTYRELTASH